MSKRAICTVCGEPPVTASEAGGDGAIIWLCPNHLEGEALELYEELLEEGWDAPTPKTIH